MEILTLIASAANVYDIVGELTEYARDINPDTARLAVKAVGRIALSVRGYRAQWSSPNDLGAEGLVFVVCASVDAVGCTARYPVCTTCLGKADRADARAVSARSCTNSHAR